MIGLQAEDGLLKGIDLEFLVDGFDVVPDGVVGKAELSSDLFDRKSSESGFKDHGFSNGQHLEGSVARGHVGGEMSIASEGIEIRNPKPENRRKAEIRNPNCSGGIVAG